MLKDPHNQLGKKKGQKGNQKKKQKSKAGAQRKNTKKSNLPHGGNDLSAKLYATMEKHKEVRTNQSSAAISGSYSVCMPLKTTYKDTYFCLF